MVPLCVGFGTHSTYVPAIVLYNSYQAILITVLASAVYSGTHVDYDTC